MTLDGAADLSVRGVAVVLARSETSPADVHGMVGAAGLLTTLGGVASHAAVVARSWAIPAITGLTGAEVQPTDFRPLVDETAGHLARLATYGSRFDIALAALRDGDASMLASPLKDSYHTVWFEYHEELITLSGRDRIAEESSTG